MYLYINLYVIQKSSATVYLGTVGIDIVIELLRAKIDSKQKTFIYPEAYLAFCKSELARSLTTDDAAGSARVPPQPVYCPEYTFRRTSNEP